MKSFQNKIKSKKLLIICIISCLFLSNLVHSQQDEAPVNSNTNTDPQINQDYVEIAADENYELVAKEQDIENIEELVYNEF